MTDFRVCDFCHSRLEEDEELEPVFIGDPPSPRPQRFKAIVNRESNRQYLLGKECGEWKALLHALRGSDAVSVRTNRRVQKVTGPENIGEVKHDPEALVEMGTEIDDSMCGASIEVEPRVDWQPDPDLEVCPYCVSALRSE